MNLHRKLMGAAGAGSLAAPFAALAQSPNTPAGAPGKVWRIGLLALGSRATSVPFALAFAQGLRELGYVEGGNLVIEWRYAEGDPGAPARPRAGTGAVEG